MKRLLWVFLWLAMAFPAVAENEFIILQSTTSTRNSGLLDAILPVFQAETGIEVRVVAVGTGQAINNARNGDGDVLLVHDRSAEDAFVADGDGVERFDLMFNDFVIIGPAHDPAGIGQAPDVIAAFGAIANSGATFVSRGDDSGTHSAEKRLWAEQGTDVDAASGGWYLETGAGMGTTLNIGLGKGAYVLADRATWLAYGSKRDHRILFHGDARLFNQYGIIAVNPARHPNVRYENARILIQWLLGPKGQAAIADFRIAGQQLFFPNAPSKAVE